jgi:hypothetical protein
VSAGLAGSLIAGGTRVSALVSLCRISQPSDGFAGLRVAYRRSAGPEVHRSVERAVPAGLPAPTPVFARDDSGTLNRSVDTVISARRTVSTTPESDQEA